MTSAEGTARPLIEVHSAFRSQDTTTIMPCPVSGSPQMLSSHTALRFHLGTTNLTRQEGTRLLSGSWQTVFLYMVPTLDAIRCPLTLMCAGATARTSTPSTTTTFRISTPTLWTASEGAWTALWTASWTVESVKWTQLSSMTTAPSWHLKLNTVAMERITLTGLDQLPSYHLASSFFSLQLCLVCVFAAVPRIPRLTVPVPSLTCKNMTSMPVTMCCELSCIPHGRFFFLEKHFHTWVLSANSDNNMTMTTTMAITMITW